MAHQSEVYPESHKEPGKDFKQWIDVIKFAFYKDQFTYCVWHELEGARLDTERPSRRLLRGREMA